MSQRKRIQAQKLPRHVTGNGNRDRARAMVELRRSGASGIHKGQNKNIRRPKHGKWSDIED